MDTPVNETEIKPEIVGKRLDPKIERAGVSSIPVLRAGIVGAGLMGKWHARAVKKAGGEIIGVADVDEKQAALLAANFPSAQSFGDVAEMLNQKSLDVLHVCAPTAAHQAIAELAIEAGVNLFIEKPIAQTAAETIRLYDLAAKNNVRLCPVHQFAFQTGVEKAKKWMSRIGQTIHLQATVCSAGGEGFGVEQLDVIAADILPHPLSLFQVVLNEILPEENWEIFRPRPGELRVFNQVRETSLSIFVSMNARPTTNSFQIVGTNGTIHLDLFHGFAVIETEKVSKGRKILHPFDLAARSFSAATINLVRRIVRREPAYPGLWQLVNAFYQSIREDKQPPITPEQAINVAWIRDYLIHRINELMKD